jgi:hypothetical protein
MESLQSDLPLGVMPWSMGWFLLETLLGLGSITLQLENHDPTVIPKYQPNYFVFFSTKTKKTNLSLQQVSDSFSKLATQTHRRRSYQDHLQRLHFSLFQS